MHFQVEPALETKFFRSVRGDIQDVIIDMRPESPTYMHHFSVILNQENRKAHYVPAMFAHGCLTLTDDTEVHCSIGEFYYPRLEKGVR